MTLILKHHLNDLKLIAGSIKTIIVVGRYIVISNEQYHQPENYISVAKYRLQKRIARFLGNCWNIFPYRAKNCKRSHI